MPVKTITAEIGGRVRKITADIPDDATPDEIQEAVSQHPYVQQIDRGVEAFDKTTAAFESQPERGVVGSLVDAGKQGLSAVNPVNIVKGLAGGVADAVTNPFGAVDRNLNPETARGLPGASGVNPVEDAQSTALAVLGDAVLPSVARAVKTGAGRAMKAGVKLAKTPGVPQLVEGIPEVTGGLGMMAHGNLYGLPIAGRGLAQTIEGARAFKTARAAAAAVPDAAPAMGSDYVMPGPQEIPANASPQQMAPFTPQTVLDYMKGQARPAMENPENTANTANTAMREAAPAEVAKRPTPGARDAQSLSDKLMEWDFTPKEAQGLNEKSWAKLAFDSGVQLPSAAVRKNAINNLIKQRQGPVLPVEQLIERFRAGGRK